MRTIEAFYAFDSSMHIILVLPVSQQAYWNNLRETYHFALRHDIADGRDSFPFCKEWVGIREGRRLGRCSIMVRPFVSRE